MKVLVRRLLSTITITMTLTTLMIWMARKPRHKKWHLIWNVDDTLFYSYCAQDSVKVQFALIAQLTPEHLERIGLPCDKEVSLSLAHEFINVKIWMRPFARIVLKLLSYFNSMSIYCNSKDWAGKVVKMIFPDIPLIDPKFSQNCLLIDSRISNHNRSNKELFYHISPYRPYQGKKRDWSLLKLLAFIMLLNFLGTDSDLAKRFIQIRQRKKKS